MALYFINDKFIHIGKPKEYSISNVKIFPESPATLPLLGCEWLCLKTLAILPLKRSTMPLVLGV